MRNSFVVVHIDNTLICSKSCPEHITHVTRVLHCLLEHGFYAKAEKCKFCKSEIAFLCYCIGPDGVSMEGHKVSAVTKLEEITTIKGLQLFLGFANFYRQFIHGFSTIAARMTSLPKGEKREYTIYC